MEHFMSNIFLSKVLTVVMMIDKNKWMYQSDLHTTHMY
jgi:hypothetical protein